MQKTSELCVKMINSLKTGLIFTDSRPEMGGRLILCRLSSESCAMEAAGAMLAGPGPTFPPFSPPSLSPAQCMKLRFESWRGSL